MSARKAKTLDPRRMRQRRAGEKLLLEQYDDDVLEFGEDIAAEKLRLALAEAQRETLH